MRNFEMFVLIHHTFLTRLHNEIQVLKKISQFKLKDVQSVSRSVNQPTNLLCP